MSVAKLVCFGIPTVFSFSSKTCSVCNDFGHCRRASLNELHGVAETPAIRSALIEHERYSDPQGVPISEPIPDSGQRETNVPQVRVSRAKHKSFELTEQQRAAVASVSVKVGQALTKLFKRGHDAAIRLALRNDEAPLADTKGYRSLKVALDHLSVGYNKGMLRSYFMTELGWSLTSAGNEAQLMWCVLPAMGVAIERNGVLMVAPSVKAQTN